ncbi:MarR family winged helix-turn-helix transcriptional regulator [Saccharothrix longispora]|uniref:DNA-binding MarR family transcriptional regulator n=1 Tax=Saccharothrix longispora TaxID=33920 RepID=A0ABU1PNT2_9PSEU|nr:MarR family winged helix-turn-helix transcriptional regulator [Saccharothrix longispora]MDR6592327.1 DNA-binding MarR family transcriptional regulator [Saccharothrix longispora]
MGRGDEREVAHRTDRVRADVASWPTGRLLSVAARVVESRFDEVLAGLGLTHAGLIALHHLADGPLAQRQLAGLCKVTDQTMSRTIERLDRSGHVARAADVRDRRRVLVEITEAGREVLAAARREEQESESLLGAVDDYDHFRHQLITLIAAAARTP